MCIITRRQLHAQPHEVSNRLNFLEVSHKPGQAPQFFPSNWQQAVRKTLFSSTSHVWFLRLDKILTEAGRSTGWQHYVCKLKYLAYPSFCLMSKCLMCLIYKLSALHIKEKRSIWNILFILTYTQIYKKLSEIRTSSSKHFLLY